MLPRIVGEFGIVMEPDVKFSDAGKCWVKLRCIAKDRKRDSNGQWSDGDPMFIDVLVFGRYAENIAESVAKGDTVLVEGRLSPNNWTDKEGNTHEDLRIMADLIGPSVAWGPARTAAANEAMGFSGVEAVVDGLGATPVEESLSNPF
jgi:single-strand DNA-binding protein